MISFHFILKNCGKKFSQSRICGQAGKVKSIYDEIYEDEEVAQIKCKEKSILP